MRQTLRNTYLLTFQLYDAKISKENTTPAEHGMGMINGSSQLELDLEECLVESQIDINKHLPKRRRGNSESIPSESLL